MMTAKPRAFVLGGLLAALAGAATESTAAAYIPVTDCGLPASSPRSGVLIHSCMPLTYNPNDVWIDTTVARMYVARAADPGDPNNTLTEVYDISDPTLPVWVQTITENYSTAVATTIGGGDGMLFTGPVCVSACSSKYARGYDSCAASNEEGDVFGHAVAAGDFNNDGFDDLAVSALGETVTPGVRSGKVYVFRGSASNLVTQVTLDQSSLQTNDDLDGFGQRLGVGDWNNDGKHDLAVTATGLVSGAASNPMYLFKGSTSGPIAWQSLVVP